MKIERPLRPHFVQLALFPEGSSAGHIRSVEILAASEDEAWARMEGIAARLGLRISFQCVHRSDSLLCPACGQPVTVSYLQRGDPPILRVHRVRGDLWVDSYPGGDALEHWGGEEVNLHGQKHVEWVDPPRATCGCGDCPSFSVTSVSRKLETGDGFLIIKIQPTEGEDIPVEPIREEAANATGGEESLPHPVPAFQTWGIPFGGSGSL